MSTQPRVKEHNRRTMALMPDDNAMRNNKVAWCELCLRHIRANLGFFPGASPLSQHPFSSTLLRRFFLPTEND